jgi:uncharacterized membrane protein
MEKNRTVDQVTAESYAASVGAVHFNTSAKLNKGIDDMFLELTKRWWFFFPSQLCVLSHLFLFMCVWQAC